MNIAILGGTGKEGRGLALRLAGAGFAVTIGSRDAGRAREKAAELGVEGGENTEVARTADLVFLSVPFDGAAELLRECAPNLKEGCVVVDTTVPLHFESGRLILREMAEGSGSQFLAPLLPSTCSLVAAFKTIPAHALAELDQSLDCDVIVCGDQAEAKARVMAVAGAIKGLRPLDGGPLRHARALEAMCALAIGLNRRYKVKSARFRVVGV